MNTDERYSAIRLYLFSGLFLISGAAGLIYEITWERLLELYFGVTMISITLIVAAYMSGLGIGSFVGGRIARLSRNSLMLYGFLELGTAGFGLASPSIIIRIGQITAGTPYPLVFTISFGILLIPTILMGMTLPILTQSFVKHIPTSGQVVGVLYGINTLGAALGAAIGGYWLIGNYGLDGAIYIAVGINALAGVVALFASTNSQKPKAAGKSEELHPISAIQGHGSYTVILLASFLVGFISLGFEMLWLRILSIVNKNTAYNFPSFLFIFLLGLAIGGNVFGRKADESKNPIILFCEIELIGATLAVFTFLGFWLSLSLAPPWIRNFFLFQQPIPPFIEVAYKVTISKREIFLNLLNYFLPILILVLPASIVLGGALPTLDKIAINIPALSGERVGDVHLANIVGSVAGTLVISFILLPNLGSELTLKALAMATFLFPLLYFMSYNKTDSVINNYLLILISGLACLLGVILVPGKNLFYQQLYKVGSGGNVTFSETGQTVIAITYNDPAHKSGYIWLGGELNSSFPPNGIYENRALACSGASKPKNILIIGFGGGISSFFFKSLPGVDKITVVELLDGLSTLLATNLESARITLADSRVSYTVDDGRRYLNAYPDKKFDLISIDPLYEYTTGSNNLYSIEAFKIYESHLAPNGVLCAWTNEKHVIPYTMAQVFPHIDQFGNQFMVASNSPIHYDRNYMDQATADYSILAQSVFGDSIKTLPSSNYVLSQFQRSRDRILVDEKHTQILHDKTPWLEYYYFSSPIIREIITKPQDRLDFEDRIK